MPSPSGSTPIYGFPYLLETDVPDIATASEDLALAVETEFVDSGQSPYGQMGASSAATFSSGGTTVVTMSSIALAYGITFSSNGLHVAEAGLYECDWAVLATLASTYTPGSGNTFDAGPFNGTAFYTRRRGYPSNVSNGAYVGISGSCQLLLTAAAYVQLAVDNLLGVNLTEVNDVSFTYLHLSRSGSS